MTEFSFNGQTLEGIPFTFRSRVDADPLEVALRGVERLRVHFDAGTRRGNPGPSGIAVYAKIPGVDSDPLDYHLRLAEFVGDRTNNEAEWLALIMALEVCERHGVALKQLELVSDSKLVVYQARGQWHTRGNLRPLRQRAHEVAVKLVDRGCHVTIEHVHREDNAEADRLVTDLLDDRLGCRRGY